MEGNLERTMGRRRGRFRPDPDKGNQGHACAHREKAPSSRVRNQTKQGGWVGRMDDPGTQSHSPGALG
eukprot:11854302-Heterocapsa_arctica.AAC.1